ncbi:hypothetical protein CASFOL_009462 [Castilleja foliolosa]|uniref:Uncharacterized protein n=1 Tax=Castilleja foliolosa TaxID=1961234 RepID=A0ABD3DXE6_9LAMI
MQICDSEQAQIPTRKLTGNLGHIDHAVVRKLSPQI